MVIDPKQLEELRQARRQWEATTLRGSLEQEPERAPRFSTLSDMEIARLYAPDDLPAYDPARDLGLPGEYPFTRGIHPTMYRGRLWTMRQFAGFGSPEDSNRRFHYLLEHGQTGLSVAFDMPTLMGYDSDHARSQGEVGREGVAVDTLEDMEILFRGLPLDRITTSMTINAPANVLLAMYVVAGEDAALATRAFPPRLSFFFDCHNNFFEEIAKFRAARRVWARIMRERFRAKSPRAWWLRFHTQTAGVSLTAQQPQNNIVRVTLQALAAVLGGTQSLHTNSMDETFALPTEEAVMVALRTQQIIAYESGVTHTVDPLGGAYVLEGLTHRVEAEAGGYIREIDDLGGMVRAGRPGDPQRGNARASYCHPQQ